MDTQINVDTRTISVSIFNDIVFLADIFVGLYPIDNCEFSSTFSYSDVVRHDLVPKIFPAYERSSHYGHSN